MPKEYIEGLARVEAREAKEAAELKVQKKVSKEKMEQQIADAVKLAVANSHTLQLASLDPDEQAETSSNIDVDWSKSSAQDITVFYPGTASIEWILGRKHGGKRAFSKGDRCVECHGEETDVIGQTIVSGESEKNLEPNVIPGKRGSIPVQIDATHDNEHLYLRFSWVDGEHAPVPFVEGGKMDPENPMKLAYMLATDDVEFADRAGCWGSCHADVDTMPFEPSGESLLNSDLAQRLNLNAGITKYIKESREKLEIKGRKKKPLGGWDKLKDDAEIQTVNDSGLFMDLIRYKSGTGEIEDGKILEKRDMHGGQGSEVEASLKAGTWSVVIKRKLRSDSPGDVNIEPGKVYNFGFAIHDDYSSARYHHVSLGYKLALDNPDAEINATQQ
ncbi:ethylbenzene dehydrogenase-related protein [Pseudoalteromonas sp. C2R02]|uniref:ethylbenzene dehydrogenase-related protein n=1 Tax=Pseudoalteromonas sp. C2R02 TaxID=2841565 RepID=UPI00339D9733